VKKLALALLAGCVFASFANASITVSLSSVTNPSLGVYDWNYSVTLDGNEGVGYPNTTSFFTVYDFPGLQSATINTGPGWATPTIQLVGMTPSTQSSITDNPSIDNVSFTYTGSQLAGTGGTVLTFTLVSVYGSPSSVLGVYAYNTSGESIGSYILDDQGQGQLQVPNALPEPASLGLMGGSLIALGLLSRRWLLRRKQSKNQTQSQA